MGVAPVESGEWAARFGGPAGQRVENDNIVTDREEPVVGVRSM